MNPSDLMVWAVIAGVAVLVFLEISGLRRRHQASASLTARVAELEARVAQLEARNQ
ncbi:hypothetical protein [Ferrimonas balearica]|uniref:hypothetical protein n=1 Tax=Ferrimonas balearica TaxID=44012 RepID=UPI001C9A1FF7|nr:hypothetical protein [Ferrimonas balearica]MBY5993192.1 hypothetical protein [Ferrimonas balearica]